MKKVYLVALAIAVVAAGIYFMTPSKGKEPVHLVACDNGWDSQRFHNELAKIVLEHAFDGYELSFTTASSPMTWESMKAGEVDLLIECWSDNFPTYQKDKDSGAVVQIGVLLPDSMQGIYVPRYVVEGDPEAGIAPMAPDLRHVKDIKKYPHIFKDEENPGKGRLYGAIPGWLVDEIMHKKFLHYGMDETFLYTRLGSEAAIFASLVSAYNLKKPWVGYCYEPTWITGKLDLIRLEDEPYDKEGFQEGKTEFFRQELYVVSSNKFKQKVSQEVYFFFQNYKTGSAGVSAALAYLDEHKVTYNELAVWFLKTNESLYHDWLPAPNAEKLKAYLASI